MHAGPIDIDDSVDFHDAWETRVFALRRALIYNEVFTLDEFRHAVERMTPSTYLTATYFQRWLDAIERLCVEKGLLSQGEVDAIALSGEQT
jgi:nitrile hydratase